MSRAALRCIVLAFALITLIPISAIAGRKDGQETLAKAFERADAEGAAFRPHRYLIEEHTWIRNGDGELEHETISRQLIARPTIDEEQVLSDSTEVVFSKPDDGDDGDESEDEEGKDGEMSLMIDFLDKERRDEYAFRFGAAEVVEGRRCERFLLKPRKKTRKHWKGNVWLDVETGALAQVNLRPAKRQFGLKSMRFAMDFFDFEGMTQLKSMEIEIEVKVPFLVHMRIQTVGEARDYELLTP